MARAWSVTDIIATKHDLIPFEGRWHAAFEKPSATGTWCVLADSGNGKTTFVLELTKELALLGDDVLIDSLEEGNSATLQRSFLRVGMSTVKGKVKVVKEDFESLRTRLRKRKSARVVIIDSIQYFRRFTFDKWLELEREFPDKLFIVVSQIKNKEPKGKVADDISYHADLKIWVEGYVAFSKGRFFGPKGHYVIWEEGAKKYHGDLIVA